MPKIKEYHKSFAILWEERVGAFFADKVRVIEFFGLVIAKVGACLDSEEELVGHVFGFIVCIQGNA